MKRLGFHIGKNDKASAKAKLRLSGIRITTSTHNELVLEEAVMVNQTAASYKNMAKGDRYAIRI